MDRERGDTVTLIVIGAGVYGCLWWGMQGWLLYKGAEGGILLVKVTLELILTSHSIENKRLELLVEGKSRVVKIRFCNCLSRCNWVGEPDQGCIHIDNFLLDFPPRSLH